MECTTLGLVVGTFRMSTESLLVITPDLRGLG
jgi:hypothetical protein